MAEQGFEYLHVEGGSPVKMWTRGVPVEDGAKAQLSRAPPSGARSSKYCN